MNTTLNILDIKGIEPEQALLKLQQHLSSVSKNKSVWLIDDHEPKECYYYLIEHDFHFQTFIVSANEYRVFISRF